MSITLRESLHVLEAAQAKAEELGTRMSLVVVDEQGKVIALHRMDGAFWYTSELVPNKAFTSAAFKRPGSQLMDLQERPFFRAFTAVHGGRAFASHGAMLLERNGEVLGVVAAGGGTPEQDEAVAQAGAEAFKALVSA